MYAPRVEKRELVVAGAIYPTRPLTRPGLKIFQIVRHYERMRKTLRLDRQKRVAIDIVEFTVTSYRLYRFRASRDIFARERNHFYGILRRAYMHFMNKRHGTDTCIL